MLKDRPLPQTSISTAARHSRAGMAHMEILVVEEQSPPFSSCKLAVTDNYGINTTVELKTRSTDTGVEELQCSGHPRNCGATL
jgi:hypothetical protein